MQSEKQLNMYVISYLVSKQTHWFIWPLCPQNGWEGKRQKIKIKIKKEATQQWKYIWWKIPLGRAEPYNMIIS